MEDSKFRFVKATEEDAAELARLRQRMWATTYRGIYPDEAIDAYDFAFYEARDRARLRDPALHAFLIKDGEESVGYFLFIDGEKLYLQSLYFLPEYRRRGLGRACLERLAAYGRERGRSFYTANCNAHNAPALAFYRAMGGEIYTSDLGHENPQEDQIGLRFPIDA